MFTKEFAYDDYPFAALHDAQDFVRDNFPDIQIGMKPNRSEMETGEKFMVALKRDPQRKLTHIEPWNDLTPDEQFNVDGVIVGNLFNGPLTIKITN